MKSYRSTVKTSFGVLALFACVQANGDWKSIASAALSGDTATTSAQNAANAAGTPAQTTVSQTVTAVQTTINQATTSSQASLASALSNLTGTTLTTSTLTPSTAQPEYVEQMKDAWEAAQSLPSFADIQGGKATAASFKTAFDKMKAVSVNKTPADFQTAYAETINSASSTVTLVEKLPSKATVTTKQGAFAALAKVATSESPTEDIAKSWTETKNAFTQLNTSREKLSDLTLKYIKLAN